jgi:hypothetical protein
MEITCPTKPQNITLKQSIPVLSANTQMVAAIIRSVSSDTTAQTDNPSKQPSKPSLTNTGEPTMNTEEILEQIQACTNLLELNELWNQYEHIPELKEAILTKCTYILSHLDD